MSTLSMIMITIGFIVFMIPSITWCYIAVKRTSGEIPWKVHRFHKVSWFFCLPISIVITTSGILISLI